MLDEDDVGTILLAAATSVDLFAATVKLLPVVLLLEVFRTRFPPTRAQIRKRPLKDLHVVFGRWNHRLKYIPKSAH